MVGIMSDDEIMMKTNNHKSSCICSLCERRAEINRKVPQSVNPKAVEGRKKPRSSFTPVVVLDEIDAGMTEGALKYGPYNWRDIQIEATDYYDSTMRHMRSWFNGEDIDPDSGVSHITKAITGLIVLRDAQLHGTCIDDRPYARSDEDATQLPLVFNHNPPIGSRESFSDVKLYPLEKRFGRIVYSCCGHDASAPHPSVKVCKGTKP